MTNKKIQFIKMHGIGNDFVIIDNRISHHKFTNDFIKSICDRHTGIGCDQFVLIEEAKGDADCLALFYNPDGSESSTCGNATRCVAHLIIQEQNKKSIKIQTKANIIPCIMTSNGNISVEMGQAKFSWQDIPLSKDIDTLNIEEISIDDLVMPTAVSMGNPHAVFFVPEVNKIELERLGPIIEHHKLFPQRTNVEIVQINSKKEITLRVWERGAGETLACGSGACAAVVAAIRKNLLSHNEEITVKLRGGNLYITVDSEYQVTMTGEVKTVFYGDM